MLHIEFASMDLYAANLIYYEILLNTRVLELSIHTDRGDISYELPMSDKDIDEISIMRDAIVRQLDSGNCWIKDYSEKNIIYIDGLKFKGRKVKSSFLSQ